MSGFAAAHSAMSCARSGLSENNFFEIKPESWAGRRSLQPGLAFTPSAPGAALLGQHTCGVVSLHLRTLAREGA